jgi:hypothetical protein
MLIMEVNQDVNGMGKRRSDYLSFLLRLWHVNADDDETAWRASLQEGLTGERMSFAGLEELFAFLRRQTGVAPDEGSDERGTGA